VQLVSIKVALKAGDKLTTFLSSPYKEMLCKNLFLSMYSSFGNKIVHKSWAQILRLLKFAPIKLGLKFYR
jgi:hypothetical protein